MPIYLQHGNLIDYVPPTDTSTEDVVFMGGLVGIPQAFIPAGELGALSVDGVYMFTKKDGVSVNLGEVVKYCGTTKLAQDSNADLTLGVAVADAEAYSLGVKVKINSVLPTDGGGGGGGSGGESGSIGLTDNNSFIVTGNDSPNDQGNLVNIGYCNFNSSYGSVILGSFTDNCSASGAVVIGSCSGVLCNANGGIAIGREAQVGVNGCGSVAIGLEAKSKSTVAGCGNIVIGSGINPYTDSALLVVSGNGDYSNFRRGVLVYAPSSDFTDVSGSSSNGGIAYVSSSDKGNSWTILCNLSF